MISSAFSALPHASKNAARAGLVLGIVASATLVASPASAEVHRDAGDEPGETISRLKAVLLFGVVPIGLFLLIALLVALPSVVRGPRYRPGQGWQGNPEWYGAPGAEAPAVGGGYGSPAVATKSSDAELTGTIVSEESASGDGGGTSARW